MKILSVDLETTGLDAKNHGVIEFAAIHTDTHDVSQAKVFHRWLNPEGYVWSNFCLNLHRDWLSLAIPRIMANQWVVDGLPIICQNKLELFDHYAHFLAQECGLPVVEGKWPRVTPAGKNFGTFDLSFLKAMSFPVHFRHRTYDPTILYARSTDLELPSLDECKRRAIEEGCGFFKTDKVSHTAVEDAWDVVHLIIWRNTHPRNS